MVSQAFVAKKQEGALRITLSDRQRKNFRTKQNFKVNEKMILKHLAKVENQTPTTSQSETSFNFNLQ